MLRMGFQMALVLSFIQMVISILGNGKMVKNTEKGQKLILVENFLLENGLRISVGMVNITITRQIQFPSLRMANYNKGVTLID